VDHEGLKKKQEKSAWEIRHFSIRKTDVGNTGRAIKLKEKSKKKKKRAKRATTSVKKK